MTLDEAALSPRRRPKGDKRARTRALLIEAARQVVREKGYERTTMEDVARRAGVTSGSIYGNFRNRDALFVAIAQTHWAPVKPEFREGSSFAGKMQALAEATIAALSERREAAAARLTGMAYAMTHEELRAEVQRATAEAFRSGAAWLSEVAEGELPMPAEQLVAVIHALTEGLMFQRFLTPELVPDEVFHNAFAMVGRLPASTPPAAPGSRVSGAKRRPRPG